LDELVEEKQKDEDEEGAIDALSLVTSAYLSKVSSPSNWSANSKPKKVVGRSGGCSFPLSSSIDGQTKNQYDYVERLIIQYFNVIRTRIAEFIPKTIMYHLYQCSVESQIKNGIVSTTICIVTMI
jgi:hypothetical protein